MPDQPLREFHVGSNRLRRGSVFCGKASAATWLNITNSQKGSAL